MLLTVGSGPGLINDIFLNLRYDGITPVATAYNISFWLEILICC